MYAFPWISILLRSNLTRKQLPATTHLRPTQHPQRTSSPKALHPPNPLNPPQLLSPPTDNKPNNTAPSAAASARPQQKVASAPTLDTPWVPWLLPRANSSTATTFPHGSAVHQLALRRLTLLRRVVLLWFAKICTNMKKSNDTPRERESLFYCHDKPGWDRVMMCGERGCSAKWDIDWIALGFKGGWR